MTTAVRFQGVSRHLGSARAVHTLNYNNRSRGGPPWRSGAWSELFGDKSSVSIASPTGETFRYYPDDLSDSGIIFYDCEPPPPSCPIGQIPNPIPNL